MTLAMAAGVEAEEWSVSVEQGVIAGVPGVEETVWVSVRPPGGGHDKIQVHRYRGGGEATAALLYLPGTNMNGELAVLDENHNLWLFLARRGIEVWALDYRTHAVPSETLESDDFMAAWTLASFVADAGSALSFVRQQSSASSIFVAGFSRGVWLAYGLVAVEGEGSLAGLIALDGGFKSHAPKGAFDREGSVARFSEAGHFASDVAGGMGWTNRDQLMRAAASEPLGPPVGERGAGFDSVGDQVASILYSAWRPGGLANPLDGVSRVEVLARLLADYDRYYPTIQNVESASIAEFDDDPGTPIDDRWGELSLPILYFGATGMGSEWLLDGIYSAGKSGSSDVTLHVLENHGHLDVLVGERSRELVFEPALAWLRLHSSH